MTRLLAALSTGFQAYAAWLVAISWKRFVVLSIVLLVIAGVLSGLPPFSWQIGEEAVTERIRITIGDEIRREIAEELGAGGPRPVTLGDFLPELALLVIFVSAALKIGYAGRLRAEAKAAEESLRRQVVEARMAAMQAQVEPHFLFNTLASIDRLIEVDPPRASTMQKNLIALLRAAMPAMREGQASLGRELQVVRPYLEIMKMRMQERLRAELAVPEGLHSADFPPMMLQSLVENAIKHGLEPRPEGGVVSVAAEVLHGKLAVTVADTGVGFGRAATAGTGTGLASIRERLKLIYGAEAELRIEENSPHGTRATIVVPYKAA
jgi:LytS/YehU family sensor histidine kinase